MYFYDGEGQRLKQQKKLWELWSCPRQKLQRQRAEEMCCVGNLEKVTVVHDREPYPQERPMLGARQEGHNTSLYATLIYITRLLIFFFLTLQILRPCHMYFYFLEGTLKSPHVKNSQIPGDFVGVNIHISLEYILYGA